MSTVRSLFRPNFRAMLRDIFRKAVLIKGGRNAKACAHTHSKCGYPGVWQCCECPSSGCAGASHSIEFYNPADLGSGIAGPVCNLHAIRRANAWDSWNKITQKSGIRRKNFRSSGLKARPDKRIAKRTHSTEGTEKLRPPARRPVRVPEGA